MHSNKNIRDFVWTPGHNCVGNWVLTEVAHRGCRVPILRNNKKKSLDMVLGNLFKMALLEKGVGPDYFQRSLPTLTIPHFSVKILFIPNSFCSFTLRLLQGSINLQLNAILSFLIIFFSKHMKNMYLCPNPILMQSMFYFLKMLYPCNSMSQAGFCLQDCFCQVLLFGFL